MSYKNAKTPTSCSALSQILVRKSPLLVSKTTITADEISIIHSTPVNLPDIQDKNTEPRNETLTLMTNAQTEAHETILTVSSSHITIVVTIVAITQPICTNISYQPVDITTLSDKRPKIYPRDLHSYKLCKKVMQ